jgi:ABC-2 type transport system ATP-binding protein
MDDTVISTHELRKSFRAKRASPIEAVRGVSIDVARGEIFGFLGPNGAGKTTTLRMLTTLLPIDAGTATVAGFDVRSEPGRVRSRIGYVSQLGGADDLATGRENLVLQWRLYGEDAVKVRLRSDELIELLDLERVGLKSMMLSEPTLDDVFLRQTGRSLRDAGDLAADPQSGS